MKWPTDQRTAAALRHVGTMTGTAVGVLAVLGVLNPEQSAAVVADVREVTDGLAQAFGGVSKLVVLLAPIATAYFAKGAVAAQSLQKQLAAIVSHPEVKVEGKILVPAQVASAVPSDKVVASGDQNPK